MTERPFACTTCGDTFARQCASGDLLRTGAPPDSGSSHRDTLLRHTRIHANRAQDGDETGARPGPTGSRRSRASGRTSGTSTPRSRHQSPVLGPLTSIDGVPSPSHLSLKHDSSNTSSRAGSPLVNRLPDPSNDASSAPLFASTLSKSQQRISTLPSLSLSSPDLASSGYAPGLRRKRTRTNSSSSSSSSDSFLGDLGTASPRAPLSRDASSTRLSEQVERWAPLGPGLIRSIGLPISDARSRPPSPNLSPVIGPLRSASSPQLYRTSNGRSSPHFNLMGTSPRSGESDSDSRSGSSSKDIPSLRLTPTVDMGSPLKEESGDMVVDASRTATAVLS